MLFLDDRAGRTRLGGFDSWLGSVFPVRCGMAYISSRDSRGGVPGT